MWLSSLCNTNTIIWRDGPFLIIYSWLLWLMWPHGHEFIARLSILFHWPMCLFLYQYQYHAFFITIALYYSLKPGCVGVWVCVCVWERDSVQILELLALFLWTMPLGFFQRRYWICRLPWIVWTFLKYWFFQFMSTRVKKKMVLTNLCPHRTSSWSLNCVRTPACPSGPGSRSAGEPLPHQVWAMLRLRLCTALQWINTHPSFWRENFPGHCSVWGGGHMNHTGFSSCMLWRFSFSLKSWGAWWGVPSFHSWRNSGFWVPSRLWVTALVNGEMCLSHA